VQSQQLLPKGEVLQKEFFSGAKDGEPSRADVEGAQTSWNHSEKRAGQMPLQVIDSAIVQSFGEAQPLKPSIGSKKATKRDLTRVSCCGRASIHCVPIRASKPLCTALAYPGERPAFLVL
jgi:hypothetical protein